MKATREPLPIPLQLQVAGLDLERNHADAAYRIYRSVLMDHPERLDAWKGLLAALHKTGHDADALAQLVQIPPDAKKQLDPDVEFEQTEASIYAANGDVRAALGLVTHVEEVYRSQGKVPPARVDIQNAWLLLNVRDDRDLYQQLMQFRRSPRYDRRSAARGADGVGVVGAAAGGAGRGGGRSSAGAGDSDGGGTGVSGESGGEQGAGGGVSAGEPAAGCAGDLPVAGYDERDGRPITRAWWERRIASQNMKQAETWVRQGLEKFPKDPKVLAAAADFELARGDRARAADYWRASLNAMPPVSPQTELAHKLDHADLVQQTKPAHGSDLVSLLNPDTGIEIPEQKGLVPLPSYHHPETQANNGAYGPDPYYTGTAPVPHGAAGRRPRVRRGLQAESGRRERRNAPRRKRLAPTGPQQPETQPYKPQASLEIPEPTPEQQAAMDAAAARSSAAGTASPDRRSAWRSPERCRGA